MKKAVNKRLYRDVEFLTSIRPYRNYKNLEALELTSKYISDQFTSCGYAIEEQFWLAEGTEYKNIIASWRKEKSRRLIIGAHYDVAGDQPGADDNASGIAGLLELARLVAEGKTAACAHFSPIGNIACACTDLWSNESVQNIKLLSGMAPTAYMEQLEYDVRLMNQASLEGEAVAETLKNLYVRSDQYTDPQALILAPENVIRISEKLIQGDSYLANAKYGALEALDIIDEALQSGQMVLPEMETSYIPILREDILSIQEDESAFIEAMLPMIDQSQFIICLAGQRYYRSI